MNMEEILLAVKSQSLSTANSKGKMIKKEVSAAWRKAMGDRKTRWKEATRGLEKSQTVMLNSLLSDSFALLCVALPRLLGEMRKIENGLSRITADMQRPGSARGRRMCRPRS